MISRALSIYVEMTALLVTCEFVYSTRWEARATRSKAIEKCHLTYDNNCIRSLGQITNQGKIYLDSSRLFPLSVLLLLTFVSFERPAFCALLEMFVERENGFGENHYSLKHIVRSEATLV